MLKGYNAVTWLVACNLAFSGLLVSWIMKFADSILKVFSTSMAMLLTMLISVSFFGTSLTLQVRTALRQRSSIFLGTSSQKHHNVSP
jgi:solute carrier family 35 (UDP-sugar transporter), member A1/2/3